MALRPDDQSVLDELGLEYDISTDGSFLTVVIVSFPLPVGLEPRSSDLLLRLPPGFPDVAPDMFWLDPAVKGSGGSPVPGTESIEQHLSGRMWQRWSRHIAGQWRPGIDNLGTYLAYIRRCLDHASGRAA